MRRSTDRILTTHVGSLPGPPEVWNRPGIDPGVLQAAVRGVVEMQVGAGVDLVNEGELTKEGGWSTFIRRRIAGFEIVAPEDFPKDAVMSRGKSLDRTEFAEFYEAAQRKGTLFEQTGTASQHFDESDHLPRVCTGPISYIGQESLQQEIDLLKGALGDIPAADAFLTTVAPASVEPNMANGYYKSSEEFLFAMADALAVEYEAIAAAGLTVQVDDAYVPALWESLGASIGLDGYRRFIQVRLEALNHALRNVPIEQTRYHLCWGSWHGPHAHDLPLKDIVDLVLGVKAGAYLIESANVRHEHEWRVWEETRLPSDRILMPGVVSHATTLIEHPDLVCDRIVRFARILGRENVVASTDCGLGARCHPQIAWAKLRTLSEGAALASKTLF